MERVRDWGKDHAISQLTEASSTDDDYLGWANTAIAARILGAKGAYRTPREDGGFMYFIFTDLGFSDGVVKMEGNGRNLIKCDSHGDACETFMCEHLMKNPRQEWFSEEADESNPWPDAWCSFWNKVFLADGEWNEKNGSCLNVQLVCHRCYEDLRSEEMK